MKRHQHLFTLCHIIQTAPSIDKAGRRKHLLQFGRLYKLFWGVLVTQREEENPVLTLNVGAKWRACPCWGEGPRMRAAVADGTELPEHKWGEGQLSYFFNHCFLGKSIHQSCFKPFWNARVTYLGVPKMLVSYIADPTGKLQRNQDIGLNFLKISIFTSGSLRASFFLAEPGKEGRHCPSFKALKNHSCFWRTIKESCSKIFTHFLLSRHFIHFGKM